MKTYLPQLERPINVRPNITFGILNYDLDNAYPQRMLMLVGASPTAKDCWNKRSKFIGGAGFEDAQLGDAIINESGLTINKLRVHIAKDKALFTGFAIHVSYNANLKKSEIHYVAFEDVRMGNSDDPKLNGKFVLYSDWGRRTWKNIMRNKFTVVHPFNDDPAEVKRQVEEAGGWDNYNGQLYYFNPEIDFYPLIEADCVWEDFETEAGIKTFNNREVTTGFLPSTILMMPSRREQADNKNAQDDSLLYANGPSQLEKDLAAFQGVKSAQKMLVLEYDDPNDKPSFAPYNIQNNDKLFESTEKSVEARIIKGFSVPQALVSGTDKKSGLADPGSEKKEAIREFNDNTQPDREQISESLNKVFAGWIEPKSWAINGIPGNVAEDAIGKTAGANINQMLLIDMPKANKMAILENAYGFSPDEAMSMVPDEGTMNYQNSSLKGEGKDA